MQIKDCKDVSIDNLQGIVSIENLNASKIILQQMESANLLLNVPRSHLTIGHLKTLHDTSFVECDSLDITLSDDFEDC